MRQGTRERACFTIGYHLFLLFLEFVVRTEVGTHSVLGSIAGAPIEGRGRRDSPLDMDEDII